MNKNLVFFGSIFILFIISGYLFRNYQYFIENFFTGTYKSKHHYGIPGHNSEEYHLTRQLEYTELQRDRTGLSYTKYKNLYGGNYDYYYDDGFNF